MKLHTFPAAPNPRRVALFCLYKNIELEEIHVDMTKGEHLTDDFRKKNPLARLPVLELETGEFIAESLAICHYLEKRFPEKPLFGETEKEQALVWMWTLRLSDMLEQPAEHAFRQLHPSMASRLAQNADWGESNKQAISVGFQFLNSHLAAHQYVCGKQVSMADIVAYCAIGFARVSKVSVSSVRSNDN